MSTSTVESHTVLGTLYPQLVELFKKVPDFGSVGFTVHFYEKEPVRIEWTGTSSKKVAPKAERKTL